MFDAIKIEKSGAQIKEACRAVMNKRELTSEALPADLIEMLEVMSTNLIDSYRYNLTVVEASFLGM